MDADTLKLKLDEICVAINLDEPTKSEAWKKFTAASEQFVLEGDKVSWLVCSLYATCCLEEIEAVDGHTTLGSFISLAKMLQISNISLYNFFSRLHQWCEMVAAPTGFSAHVHRLEQRFVVSSVVFSKYRSVFCYVFDDLECNKSLADCDPKDGPNESANKPMSPPNKRSRKNKISPCSAAELFDFGWAVFLLVKAQYRQISDNLLNCYHLALSCIDWLHSIAVQSSRRDLICSRFREEHAKSMSNAGPATRQAAMKGPSIIHLLCQRFSGVEVEALAIRQYHWQPAIKRFLDGKLLTLGSDNGIIDTDVFHDNKKAVSVNYDEYVLKTGDFDERILMAPDAHARIGSPPKTGLNAGNIMSPVNFEQPQKNDGGMFPPAKPVIGANLGAARKLMPMFNRPTPLTARERLGPASFVPSTPVCAAATTAACLLQLAASRPQGMSEALQQILDKSGKNNSAEFERLSYEFKCKLEKSLLAATNFSDNETSLVAAESGVKRVISMSMSLFYRCAELVLAKERHILAQKTGNQDADIAPIATQPTFLKSLFAVSTEIILSAFCPSCAFPWIMTAMYLAPHDLLRVIEPLVRADDHLPRETIKHLNYIEESILECYLWQADSTFWRLIDKNDIPSYEEVCLEKDHQAANQIAVSPNPQTPANTPLRAAVTASSLTPSLSRVLTGASPSAAQAVQTSAPVSNSPASSSVCRALFAGEDDKAGTQPLKSISVAASPQRIAPELTISIANRNQQTRNEPVARRSGPIALIFRKLYRMVALRLSELCNSLGLGSRFLQMAFTFTEHCFRTAIEMLHDRHVDQILLCVIYMMSRILQKQIVSFSELLKWYRKLPHANSSTYRSISLHTGVAAFTTPEKQQETTSATRSSGRKAAKRRSGTGGNDDEASEKPSAVINLTAEISPSEMAAPSADNRGDIVLFYNILFVPKYQDYAVELGEGKRTGSLLPNARFAKLSPLPCRRASSGAMLSPRHLSSQISIQPLDTSPARFNIPNQSDRLVVQVNSSPSKELQAINSALKHRATMSATRRLLGDVDSHSSGANGNNANSGQSSQATTSSSARQLLDSLGA